MQNRKQILLISSIILLPFTFAAFQISTGVLGSKGGYVVGFLLYWTYSLLTVCLVAGFNWAYIKNMVSNSYNNKYANIFNVIAFLPVVGVFFVAFLPNVAKLTLATSALLAFMAIFNGTIEEIYWRGLYTVEYKNDGRVGFFIPVFLFGAWHFSLWFARGLTYQGGAIALIGGASFMGLLWAWVTRSVGNIRACVLAHVLVNLFAFTGLFVENAF